MRANVAVFGALLACAGFAGVARADIIPSLSGPPTTLGPNLHRFTYATSVGVDSRVDAGDYLVIYDFAGFTGEHSEPAGWDFLTPAPNAGPVPLGTLPLDDPNIPNLVWTWTRESIIGQAPVGDFTANSIYNLLGFDSFAALSTRSTGPDIGSSISNVGFINVPLAPEPGVLSMLAIGAIGLLRRRAK